MMERPMVAACSAPMGLRMPWLMALLRNRILAGSMKTASSGNRPWFTSTATPADSTTRMVSMTGAAA